MKVIMTGGGTGGHIYPAIAIADEIKRRVPDAEIIFVGTEHGMEKDIVPKSGYPIRFITVSGLHRKQLWKNVETLRDLAKGMHEAKEIIKEFSPDYVIGTGGYVCGPVVYSAAHMGIHTYIHEQNAFPGLTNKLLSKKVDRVFVAFDEAKAYFKTAMPPVTVGNPVRHAFVETTKGEARAALGVGEDEFMVLSFGGSLGAKRINDEMKIAVRKLGKKDGLRIFFVTGKRYYDEITGAAGSASGSEDKAAQETAAADGASASATIAVANADITGTTDEADSDTAGASAAATGAAAAAESTSVTATDTAATTNVTYLKYLDDMPTYLAACDLAITRSGALTVSEICASGRASVMIPSPYVTSNHQYFNAKVVADRGGAVLIEEKDLQEGAVAEQIERLMSDVNEITKMEKASHSLGTADAANVICDTIGIK